MFNKTNLLALGAIAAMGFTASSALAQAPAMETVSIKVPYADLDLNNPAGAQVMASRIRHAAREICGGEEHERGDLTRQMAIDACIKTTSGNAAAKLSNALVTAYLGGASKAATLASR